MLFAWVDILLILYFIIRNGMVRLFPPRFSIRATLLWRIVSLIILHLKRWSRICNFCGLEIVQITSKFIEPNLEYIFYIYQRHVLSRCSAVALWLLRMMSLISAMHFIGLCSCRLLEIIWMYQTHHVANCFSPSFAE